ncbi:AAA family ATPase [Segatella hominis]|uniref:AAA family ATPase n=1 Tax=Segatella hominis TaxID=2518605 RepID=UPI001C473C0D|nr:AAA family ATPase [Segatella hominis]WOZ81439.1 AAA family ATPase [Segatella hominis]
MFIDNKGNIERVPLEVFETINPDMILLLEASSDTIRKRLIARDSKEYSLSFINDFLQEEKAYANEVANVLDIPFKICSQDEMDAQIENISCYLESE